MKKFQKSPLASVKQLLHEKARNTGILNRLQILKHTIPIFIIFSCTWCGALPYNLGMRQLLSTTFMRLVRCHSTGGIVKSSGWDIYQCQDFQSRSEVNGISHSDLSNLLFFTPSPCMTPTFLVQQGHSWMYQCTKIDSSQDRKCFEALAWQERMEKV